MKRSKKNLDGRIRQIVSLALRVNRETKHDIIVEVRAESISVYGFIGEYNRNKDFDFYEHVWNDMDGFLAELGRIRAKLKSLLPKNK